MIARVTRALHARIGGFGFLFLGLVMPMFLGFWIWVAIDRKFDAHEIRSRIVGSVFIFTGAYFAVLSKHREDVKRDRCRTARGEARELVRDLLVGARANTETKVTLTELECIERGLEEPPV